MIVFHEKSLLKHKDIMGHTVPIMTARVKGHVGHKEVSKPQQDLEEIVKQEMVDENFKEHKEAESATPTRGD